MPDGAKTVLHVEDNDDNRILVKRLLQFGGYQVIEACNANEALESIKSNVPDLILLDINMPEVDGYSLTGQIKAKPGFNTVPVIAITANALKGDRERSYQAGCDGYIEKPIDIDTFLDQIESYIV
jgi:two-component system, cell cycle response regulator DivK